MSTKPQYLNKRITFHKQIRTKNRQQYFKAQRKKIYLEQKTKNTSSSCPQQQNINLLKYEDINNMLNDDDEVNQLINWQVINSFLIKQQNHCLQHNNDNDDDNHLNQLLSKITNLLILKQQNITSEHALAAFINLLAICKEQESQLNDDIIKQFVEKLIPANTVRKGRCQQQQLRFASTIFYFLYTLSECSKQKGIFEPLIKYYEMFQRSEGYMSPQYILMISSLSSNPNLIPSERTIISILQSPLKLYQSNKDIVRFVCRLVENSIRAAKQQSFEFTQKCVKFIFNRIKQKHMSTQIKNQLINLLTSIVLCASSELESRLLQANFITGLIQEIYYRSQFGSLDDNFCSLKCFCVLVRMVNSSDEYQFDSFIDLNKVCVLLANALEIAHEDQILLEQLIETIMVIAYKNHKNVEIFKRQDIIRKLQNLLNMSESIVSPLLNLFQSYSQMQQSQLQ